MILRHETNSRTHAVPIFTHYQIKRKSYEQKIAVREQFLFPVLHNNGLGSFHSLWEKFNTQFSGYTFIEAGEVEKGQGEQNSYDHRWMEDAGIGIFSSTRIDEHLKVLAGFEA